MSLPGQRSVQRSRTDPGSLRIGTCGAIRLPGAHLSADSLLPGSQNWQLLAYLRAILGLAGLEFIGGWIWRPVLGRGRWQREVE